MKFFLWCIAFFAFWVLIAGTCIILCTNPANEEQTARIVAGTFNWTFVLFLVSLVLYHESKTEKAESERRTLNKMDEMNREIQSLRREMESGFRRVDLKY